MRDNGVGVESHCNIVKAYMYVHRCIHKTQMHKKKEKNVCDTWQASKERKN